MGANRGGGYRDRGDPATDRTRRYRGGEESTRRDPGGPADRDEGRRRERGRYDPDRGPDRGPDREREAREERERRRADDARRRYYEQQYGYYDEYTGQWVPGRADDTGSRSQMRAERAKWTGIVLVSVVAAVAAIWVTLAVVNAPPDEAATPAEPAPQQAPQQPAPAQPAPAQPAPQAPEVPEVPQGPSEADQTRLREAIADLQQTVDNLTEQIGQWFGQQQDQQEQPQ